MVDQSDAKSCATYLEYHGIAGATSDCEKAVERLLHTNAPIERALILTHENSSTADHALFLTDAYGDQIVIKTGFASGYGGTGPTGFSSTLALLTWHGVELEEILIDEKLLERLDASALTISDLEMIQTSRRVRPRRLWEYLSTEDSALRGGNPWVRREPIIPLGLMDERLAEDARDFWNDPDGKLIKAHRRLEEVIREKADLSIEEAANGPSRLYALAFNGKEPRLRWSDITASEHVGRTNLFVGTLAAYRNPRAHRTDNGRAAEQLAELLLVNHLYRLEATLEWNPHAPACPAGEEKLLRE